MIHYGTTLAAGWPLRDRSITMSLLLGATWPDLPWVLLRGLHMVVPISSSLTPSYYVQPFATPLMCLWAGVIFACCVRRPRRQAVAFVAAAWLHLLLDACQTRFGNGVAFLYPLSGKLYDFEVFWEESPVGLAMLALSVGFVAVVAKQGVASMTWKRPPAMWVAVLLVGYFAMPVVTWSLMRGDDTFGMAFVSDPTSFEGRTVGFDRNLLAGTNPPILRTWYGRDLRLVGVPAEAQAGDIVSVRGRYTDGEIAVEAFHVHLRHLHDVPSMVALAVFVVILWRARRNAPSIGVNQTA
jgi:hypothetical protein